MAAGSTLEEDLKMIGKRISEHLYWGAIKWDTIDPAVPVEHPSQLGHELQVLD